MSVEACVWIFVIFLCLVLFVCLGIFCFIALLQNKNKFIKCELKEFCSLKTKQGCCYSENKIPCTEVPEAFKS